MGLLGLIGKGIGAVGKVVRRVGEIGQGIAQRVKDNAIPIASGIGNIVGGKIGDAIRGVGSTVANIAGTGVNVAKSVSQLGNNLMGNKGAQPKPPPDIARQLG